VDVVGSRPTRSTPVFNIVKVIVKNMKCNQYLIPYFRFYRYRMEKFRCLLSLAC